jgi:hypothetical protein
VTFGAIEEAVGQSLAEGDGEDFGVDLDAEDDGKAERPASGGDEEDGIDFRFVDSGDDFLEAFRSGGKGRKVDQNALDRDKLEGVLRDLIACRQMLERVMKDG